MADVTGRDRAQMFLIAALVVSMLLIVLALLLNTAIYTSNIATRNVGPGTTELTEYERAVDGMAREVIPTVNHENNSSYASLKTAFESSLENWSDAAATHHHSVGTDAHVSLAAVDEGTRIQQDTHQPFTSDGGNSNWTVAGDVRARNFSMNVSQDSVSDVNLSAVSLETSTAFRVDFVADDGSEWNLYVYNSTLAGGEDVTVAVTNDAGTTVSNNCRDQRGANGHVVINVTGETVGDTDCPALGYIFENLTSYQIRYERAVYLTIERVNGTYSLVVNAKNDSLTTGADDDTTRDPYVTPALYSVTIDVVYRSPVSYYETQVRVAPGENDG